MGADTNVGERGGQVSVGQAQRIQIARALCKDAPISALDQDTGQEVMTALQRLMKNRTVVHVTHHPRTLDGHAGGEWLTRLNNDIHTVGILMNGPLNMPHMVVALLNTILSSFLMMKGSLPILIITWVFLLLHLLFNEKIVLRHMQGLKEEAQKAMEESTASIGPLITEADTILLYDAGGMLMKKCDECSRRLMKANRSIQFRKAIGTAVQLMFGLGGYLAALFAGYGFMKSGIMSFSDVGFCLLKV